jgi:hypothetical protein
VVQSILPNRTAELDGGAGAYGILLGAMGIGALAGGFSRQLAAAKLGSKTLPLSVGLFGISGVALGLANSMPLAVVSLLVAGLTWVWALATLNATAQLMSPAWVRGRAMSLYTLSFVGILPLGSILAGRIADSVGADSANVILGGAGVLVGFVAAPLLHIPNLDDIQTPEFEENRQQPDHVVTVGGPVLITTNWSIDQEQLERFLREMHEVRLVRLRTGAYRWRLYRDASDPHRLTELFLCVSWEEHLAQHRRIDDASAAILRNARSFDRNGRPTTSHRIAVDIENPANWDELLESHASYHSQDGSIPLTNDEPAAS